MAKKKNKVRDDGRIAVQVYIGRDENGKRKYKTVYGTTQKEADEKALEVKISLSKGLDVLNAGTTFQQLVELWLATKKLSVCDKQYRSIYSRLQHALEALGPYPAVKILPYHIQGVINDLAEFNPNTRKPTAKRTLQRLVNNIIEIFDFAAKNKLTDYNPAKYVTIPAGSVEKRYALTEQEQQWINEFYAPRKQLAAMIMLYSGLRRGELIALQWKDIDLKEGTISVTKAVEMIGNQPKVKNSPKTSSSYRKVYLPQRLVEFLKTEYEKTDRNPLALVVTSANGKMLTESSFKRMWESYIKDLNFEYGNRIDKQGKLATSKCNKNGIEITIRPFSPHCLRHTFATMLYFAGVDVLTAKEQLGHSDIKTTLQIYTHLDAQHKTKNMSKLDSYLDNASQVQVSENS